MVNSLVNLVRLAGEVLVSSNPPFSLSVNGTKSKIQIKTKMKSNLGGTTKNNSLLKN
jgi:hypothetical protein